MSIESFTQMTVAEIARQTGISIAQWSRYFNKKKTINESTLEQLKEAIAKLAIAFLFLIALRYWITF
jgi:transcriptional regulator with XRE-family HTH domain